MQLGAGDADDRAAHRPLQDGPVHPGQPAPVRRAGAARYCPREAARTAVPTPSSSSARSPFAAREIAAPASSGTSERSSTVTSQPTRRSPSAAASPPIPPPTTTAVPRTAAPPVLLQM
ncbi:hypothetical protein KCH_09030 [Kitasatospora cheerisanensis KCTC 2395]|uniref:Uncharacterized protein n=1 Tax=Kitasatospora cheerisanensis KCTC 2395 TaxID=1348663 RepID=A0A066Z1G3_9ACTN|nr:hypothetical protein KCH_09030 [Kitasatospora cheerisanensis KCTC 2395]